MLILLFITSILGCSKTDSPPPQKQTKEHRTEVQILWRDNINTVLKEPLWRSEFAYDAATTLMLPMHYAFKYPERFSEDPRVDFDLFFTLMELELELNDIENRVTRTQFIYFITQYLKINQSKIREQEYLMALFRHVEANLIDLWLFEKAVHWDAKLEFSGIIERLLWKLSEENTNYAYYKAVVDEEWATLVALSDLIYISKNTGIALNFKASEVIDISDKLVRSFGDYSENEFFFQKGVWYDHPDYRYAGNDRIYADMLPFPVEGIAIDSSHSHRMPLWLISMRDVAQDESLFSNAINGIRNSFESNAFKQEFIAGERLFLQTNYLDGNNGVYRFNYDTQGEGRGYEAYQLSGTLFVGYYAFMGSNVYSKNMIESLINFPLSESALSFYVGPNTTRNRHPKFAWPEYFNNGFALLFANIAGCYNVPLTSCQE